MFILHVKHYFFQEILKVHSLQEKMQSQHFITLTSDNYKIFEVPVLDFARAILVPRPKLGRPSLGLGTRMRQCLRQRSVSREALGPRMITYLRLALVSIYQTDVTSFSKMEGVLNGYVTNPFSYPEPFLRAVNRARRGALAKSISNWHLIGYNEGYCSNNVYIFYHVFMVSGFGFGQSPSSHRA